jgi:predicted RNA-binding protein with PUA-like domain
MFYLAKTDPDTYSIDDLAREKETKWDGVHNNAALLVIQQWKPGDQVFVYHSQGENRIMGLMEITSLPELDTKDTRRSYYAWVKFLKKYKPEEQITLKEIKAQPQFADFALVRQGRLSTMACPDNFVAWMHLKNLI